MFKELLSFFKGKNLIEEAFDESIKMLKYDYDMFMAVKKSLRERDTEEIDCDVYKHDKLINKYEREVRKKVMLNLSITGSTFLNAGLVLVSIVIDIERIGDYMKNIAELAKHHPLRLKAGIYEERIQKIEKIVEDKFPAVIKALQESDEVLAREKMDEHKEVSRTCDEILFSLIKEEDKSIRPSEAVTITLYTRYLKRINSHLTNIATSIVNPFHRIGFYTKVEETD